MERGSKDEEQMDTSGHPRGGNRRGRRQGLGADGGTSKDRSRAGEVPHGTGGRVEDFLPGSGAEGCSHGGAAAWLPEFVAHVQGADSAVERQVPRDRAGLSRLWL